MVPDMPGYRVVPVKGWWKVGDFLTFHANVTDPFTGQRIAKKGDVGEIISNGPTVLIRLRR
jgi:hypothetical protein